MQLHDQRVILTGASSGIGLQTAHELAGRGAQLVLVGRREPELEKLRDELQSKTSLVTAVAADITTSEGRDAVVRHSNQQLGGIDVLINNAGVSEFAEFAHSDPGKIEQLIKTNVTAPMLLTRVILPQMLNQKSGQIVNIGSVFGSLGFAYFAAYSTSKFAIRGFSEALRRELSGSGVGVTYLAPRAVKTGINSKAVYRMAEAVKMKMDAPATVAGWIVRCLEKDKQEAYYGLAETFFVKLNALLPRLVDKGTDKQNRQMREFATISKS